MNTKQKILVVVIDILILLELAYSIIQGKNNPEYMTPVFFKNFIPLVIITLILARVLFKKFKTEEIESDTDFSVIKPK